MTEPGAAHLHHVALVVKDADAAFAFYRDVLGLEAVDRPDGAADPGSWFDLGDGHQLHLFQPEDPTRTLPHFAVRVADLEATVAAIRAQGVPVYPTEHQQGFGHQAFVLDPSGNLIELNQADERGAAST